VDCQTGCWNRIYSDPVKGAASDSFKRACTNIGIGRELYTAPFIWVPADKVKIERYKEKLVCKDKFKVNKISYNDKRCVSNIVISNQRDEVVYSFNNVKAERTGSAGTSKRALNGANTYAEDTITEKQADELMHIPAAVAKRVFRATVQRIHQRHTYDQEGTAGTKGMG